ncbi:MULTISPECIES: glycosyltransferase [Methylobacteriaceae]|uniref:glycosyltransferase n=1 Tax=Methylobacteriaceae TaxID=119045 RepID=UPI002F35279E
MRKTILGKINRYKRILSFKSKRPVERLENGLWQNHFLPTVYSNLNPDLDPSTATSDHFRTTGYKEVRPFHHVLRFDPIFYRDLYPDIAGFSDQAAYRHWLIYGLGENRFESARGYLNNLGFPGEMPPFFATAHRQDGYEQLASDYHAFRHFLLQPENQLRDALKIIDTNLIDLKEIAKYFNQIGEVGKAILCLEQAAYYSCHDSNSLHVLADLKLQKGDRLGALKLYEDVLTTTPYALWPAVNSAAIYASFGDFKRSHEIIAKIIKRLPDMYHLRLIGKDYVAQHFEKEHLYAIKMAAGGRVAESRSRLQSALDLTREMNRSLSLDPATTTGIFSDRIAIFAYNGPSQCFRYRVDYKIKQLQSVGQEASWFDASDPRSFRDQAPKFGAVIFYRVPGTPEIAELIHYVNSLGIPTFYEIDDLIIDPENYPPALESMGGLVTKEEWGRFVLDPLLFAAAARICKYGIGSTTLITDALSKLVQTGSAVTIRNGYIEKDYSELQSKAWGTTTQSKITIFYGSGSRSHTGNFYNGAAQAIFAIMKRHGEVDLHIVGPLLLDDSFKIFGTRVKRSNKISTFATYLDALKQADINIAPLDGSIFADAKSEIKWLEAALVGVPSVVSTSSAYREVVRNGVDAFLCSSESEWYSALDNLVRKAPLRQTMAEEAYNTARSKYNELSLGSSLKQYISAKQLEFRYQVTSELKVALVNVYFAPQTYGGATRIVETLAKELKCQDLSVEVFTSLANADHEGQLERYSAINCDITAVAPGRNCDPIAENDFVSRAAFADFLVRFKPDVVNFHCIQGLTPSLLDEARAHCIPTVVSIHDGWWISDHQFLVEPNGALVEKSAEWGNPERLNRLRRALTAADRVVSVSKYFAKLYNQRIGIPVEVIPNPVARLDDSKGPEDGPLVLGLLGGLGLAKGGDLIYLALSLQTFLNLKFILVDHSLSEGQSRIENWGNNSVTIVGKIKQGDIGGLYKKLNVVLAPSVCIESFGLVVHEAISLGKWVVVSDRGALSESVSEGRNGFIIDVSDVAGLLKILRLLDKNPELYRFHSATSLDIPTDKEVGQRYAALYREVMNSAAQCEN